MTLTAAEQMGAELRHPSRAFRRWVPLALAGWVIVLYGWTCWFGLVNDDFSWIEQVRLASATSWLSAAFGGLTDASSLDSMRKLVRLSIFLNYLVGGAAPFGYHAVNVALEIVNTYLVWLLARAVLGDTLAGPAVAALFAAHPSQAGTVAWIVGRTELVADAFYLGALLLHIRRHHWLAAGLFTLALFSKENAVTFPAVAFVVDLIYSGRSRAVFRSLATYTGVLVAYAALREWMAHGQGTTALTQAGIMGIVRLVPSLLTQAAHHLLEPLPLGGVAAVVTLAAVVVVCLLVTQRTAMHRAAQLGGLWMFLTLLPFLGLSPLFGFFYFYPRHAYLPSVGFGMLVVSGASALAQRGPRRAWLRAGLTAGAIAWVIACVAVLEGRNEQWRRNGVMTGRVIDGIAAAVPHPAPHTLFVVEGLGPLRLGHHAWAHTPVLLFGLADALRMRLNDPTLDATFASDRQPHSQERPVVILHWVDAAAAFVPGAR